MVMAAKFTRLTHKIAVQLHLVAESCIICSSRSRRPVRRLLDTYVRTYTRARPCACIHTYSLLLLRRRKDVTG